MSYQVLARKWRPKTFAQMVGQAHVLKALKNALDQDRLHHAYLFTGTRGVGKTTLARILAKCLNCDQGVGSSPCEQCNTCLSIDQGQFIDLIEVDAASRSKVEETRDLMDNVQYAPSSGRYKVYLIDEVHMFSNHSFNALLKTLEEPPPHVKFLLATTESKKIPVTILSRCLQFNLSHLGQDQIAEQIKVILSAESITFDEDSVAQIARGAQGSMRDALSLLDQAIAYTGGTLEAALVHEMMGTVDQTRLHELLQALNDDDPAALLNTIAMIAAQNPDFDALLSAFLSLLQNIAIIQLLPANATNPLKQDIALNAFAEAMSPESVQLYYQIGMLGRKDIYLAPDLKSGFEMVMIRMFAFMPSSIDTTIDTAIDKAPSAKPSPAQRGQITNTSGQDPQQKTPPVSTAQAGTDSDGKQDWQGMIAAMGLAGLIKEFANHCVLKEQTDAKMALSLSSKQAHLLNENRRSQLEQAIQTHFGQQIKLEISVADSDNETPAQQETRHAEERQNEAQQSINNDPVVGTLVDIFDAEIEQDSIQPK